MRSLQSPDINSCLYSDQTSFQTNIRPTPLDDLFQQFESEVVAILDILTEVFTSNANFYEVCSMTNNFISLIDISFEELEFLCLKKAKRNFHARLSGIVEPLLQKVPSALLLPTLKVHSPDQMTLVASEMNLEAGSVYGWG